MTDIEARADTLIGNGHVVLALFMAERKDDAAAAMAAMDRSYDAVIQVIEDLSTSLRRAEARAGQQRLADARHLKHLETGLGVLFLALILAVLAYGRHIGVVFQTQLAQLSTFNARLEAKIHERTDALERANRDVVALNMALAAHVEDLTRTQVDLAVKEQTIHAQNHRFQQALRHLTHAVAWFDAEANLVVCNDPFATMWKVPTAATEPGTSLSAINAAIRVAGRIDAAACDEIEGGRNEADRNHALWQRVVGSHDTGFFAVRHAPMPDGGTLSTYTDVTVLRRLEQQIAHLAHHDSLTELLNRHGLADHLQRAFARLDRGEGFALLCLDLDHFKQVNDTHGHPVGDKLLQQVANRLQSCVRDIDLVARIGGDEFAIVQSLAEQPDGAAHLARRIIDVISAPYVIDGQTLVVGTSIGIALAPDDGRDLDALLQHGDLALYRAKTEGRGAYRLYHPDMDAEVRERRRFEADLRAALAADQFRLHYQPLVDTTTHAIVGFEALLRWQHPERGLVPPSAFIGVAEEIGLMSQIGAWVLKTACMEASRWPAPLKIAVNVSPMQFRDHRLDRDVVAAVAGSGLAPSRLELEITETVLLEDGAATIEKLRTLRALGVRIALDDFGTGYSSLAYLQSFPFDKVKIDRTFIQGVTDSEASMAIVRAVVGLSGNLGMATTAEGVETPEQLDILCAEGCREAQGYIFSRPVPADAVATLLATRTQAARAAA
jgi:diguanylate cyclase (GGDEF)-like protein